MRRPRFSSLPHGTFRLILETVKWITVKVCRHDSIVESLPLVTEELISTEDLRAVGSAPDRAPVSFSSMQYCFCWAYLCWSIVSKKSAALILEDAVLFVTGCLD